MSAGPTSSSCSVSISRSLISWSSLSIAFFAGADARLHCFSPRRRFGSLARNHGAGSAKGGLYLNARAALIVSDLHYRYQPDAPWAVEGVGLRLEPGEIVGLLGP